MLDRSPGEPISPAREFGEEIKAAREARGWTQEQLAEALHCGQPYVSKVERGEQLASAAFAIQCDRVFGTPGTYARMRQRAADAGSPTWLIPYLQLERQSVSVCDYSPGVIAGILQTPRYAEAVFRATRPDDSADHIRQRVDDRMRRREVFESPEPPNFWVIVHEATLWSATGGPHVMREQLRHLAALAEHPRITVQVFPLSGTPARKTPFILLRQRDGTEVLFAESYVKGHVYDSPVVVTEARTTYERLRANALSLPDSLSLIQHVMEAYDDETRTRPHPSHMDKVQPQRGKRRNLRRMGPRVHLIRRRPDTGQ
ncbi:helix-turn-helix domain-containing protein [Streptomyces mobaraensis NBRC 13819 = DSM 40847]|uniref:Helix-turn-helix domain-containing protein n=1 Tax=Streptomyces mobaraensis (strain ATCC 29032 / DSM 40847 / JCM 4168 / NBRC 13819 / NCIMB 11159 / IPCR 16-22) TaxID=1223523 RepID=M3C301_STRM1|nr:helix-turn-helix transcriptional regulator [Streptomyces mobaraensis]EME98350.1 helix-turn-helix domain-containing protein [Streptomyces mobaraensis NBRC 13819 = DSM 40847]